MEFYFMANGIYNQLNLFESMMQAQFFNWQRRNLATNQVEQMAVQGALRPIRFYRYVFPQDSLKDVMTNMRLTTTPSSNEHPNPVNPNVPLYDKYAGILRVALKLKKLPPFELIKGTAITRPMYVDGVSIMPIGLKTDKIDPNEVIGFEQEML